MVKEQNIIELHNITVSFDGETVLDDLDLSIKDGEFVTFLGASGCGKTTTLRVIAGFISPDHGDVFFDGARINDLPPHKRQVNTIFQRYALFPHLNVFDNVAFGLKVAGMKKDQIKEKVEEMLELVNMRAFAQRKIHNLSGGQQQRVAIARALVNNPRVLLLDEPLAALDYKLRKDMQNELKRIQRQTGITFIFVTHDQEEALSMSDTVVVMNEGKIQQIGSPTKIYNEPENAFVADFIGESNIIDGVMLDDFKVRLDGRAFKCLDKGFAVNEPVDVVIRPEDVDIVSPEKGELTGEVSSITFKGDYYEMIVDVCGFKWMVQATDEQLVGAKVGLVIEPDAIHIMKKSKYSGMFGDYSTFSTEMDEMEEEARLEEERLEEEAAQEEKGDE
ncbi:MAG: ABC transporter ATP-binding protein [Clostridia bacterium]|nr:ABC transporter ATP-binding protein [Clostridia bacterium]MBQ9130639.1 ABC transporter ATP-binding protein [Clostridia bacterium]